MSVPTWSGEEHPIGPYRYRILWFRVLFVAGIAGAFAAGYSLNERVAAVTEAGSLAIVPVQPDGTRAHPSPSVEEDDASQDDGETVGCWAPDEPPVPISAADRAALLEAARTRLSDVRAREATRYEQAQATERYLDAQQLNLNFNRIDLVDAIRYLAEVTELNYGLSPGVRELVGNEETAVTLHLKDVSLRSALNLIVAQHDGLSFRVRGASVWIRGYDDDPEPLTTEIYRIDDLVNGNARKHGGVELDLDVLCDVLSEAIPEDEGHVEFNHRTLIARLSAEGHAATRALINQLRSGHRQPTAEPLWVDAIKHALATRTVDLHVNDRPLSEVLDQLRQQTQLNFAVGHTVDPELSRVSLRLNGLLLQDALDLINEQTGHCVQFAHEALVFEDSAADGREVYLEVFDVRDLLTWLDPEVLEELVWGSQDETNWEGEASTQIERGYLFVFQGLAQHEAVRDTLAKLRVSYDEGEAELKR